MLFFIVIKMNLQTKYTAIRKELPFIVCYAKLKDILTDLGWQEITEKTEKEGSYHLWKKIKT